MRGATLEDLASIVEIYNSIIPGQIVSADTEPVSVEQRLPWFYEHDPARRPIRVAEEDGEIIGWLSLGDFWDGRPAYNATAEIGIYVKEGHRGKGIGGRMLEETIRRAPDLGIKTLTAGPSPATNSASGCSNASASKDGRSSHASPNSTATSKTSSSSDSDSKRKQPAPDTVESCAPSQATTPDGT
jgi:L-amino acid N-acyltransferase YncA